MFLLEEGYARLVFWPGSGFLLSDAYAAWVECGQAYYKTVATLADTESIARRVLGGAHPLSGAIGRSLQNARTVLRAREAGEKFGES